MKTDFRHIDIGVRYIPFGVVDFNRAELLSRYLATKIPSVVWLDELEGWKGETDAYLSLFVNRHTQHRQDYPKGFLTK